MDTNTMVQTTRKSLTKAEMIDSFTDALLQGYQEIDQVDHNVEFSLLDNSLIMLIRDLSETLLPIEPSTAFVEKLKQQLLIGQVPTQVDESPQKLVQGRWVRTIMSVFTIVGVASRIIGVFVLLTALLLRRRRQVSPA